MKKVIVLSRINGGRFHYWKWEDVVAGKHITTTTDRPENAFGFDSMTDALRWASYINARETENKFSAHIVYIKEA